ncbi:hypothetical protein FOXYSP1_11901 [Fusarium oxysporum f. sp. phaseoli]
MFMVGDATRPRFYALCTRVGPKLKSQRPVTRVFRTTRLTRAPSIRQTLLFMSTLKLAGITTTSHIISHRLRPSKPCAAEKQTYISRAFQYVGVVE